MEEVGGDVVLIVNGVLIRDDGHKIQTILEKVHRIMDTTQALAEAITALEQSVADCEAEITEILSRPQPDNQAAIDRVAAMKASVDAATQQMRDALVPPVTPP